ncbi:MAG: hypothetical protein N2037_01910 [Acidimicrobiales bacterium]|nr:hypothetical protein [Acidimicrobiales bacterium]
MTEQVEFSTEELLMSHDYAEPLVVNGVRCHGGFDEEGNYVSPRTLYRAPAIEAWEAKRRADFGTDPLDVPIDAWPENFPNVEQSKFLIRQGITEPTIAALTRIGTVEGFGAMMRYLPLPDFRQIFADDITGTATDHIRKGLFEAHSRDEAGWEQEAGHDKMWFAARDIAFENPVTEDQTALMLERMGITAPGGGIPDLQKIRAFMEANRALPKDIPLEFEGMLSRMIGLLFIEISAFHAFRWAEAVLGDPDLVAGDGQAGRIVSYIRQDETPHVGYLQVALSEMRDRTWVGETGTRYNGEEMIQLLWDRALQESRFLRRADFLRLVMREVERAIGDRPDRDDIIDEFISLGSVQRLPDGTLVEIQPNGDEVRAAA